MQLNFDKFDSVNKLFLEAESAWQEHFSEQRSNILLVTGKHYQRRAEQFWERARQDGKINEQQKIRFTKNHTQVVTKFYVDHILGSAPGVRPFPANEDEVQDRKAAELNWKVWDGIKRRHNIKDRVRQDAHNFVELGEVAEKIYWDASKGRHLGDETYEEKGEDGIPVQKTRPVFTGDLCFERILGFNLLIDPAAKSPGDDRYCFVRKLIDIEELKSLVGDDKDKLQKIQEATQETYTVFDVVRGNYGKSVGKAELRECYVRPCKKYPKGLYIYFTPMGEVARGELPLGIYPIIYKGFDDIETTPRGSSIIRPVRPYQAEINRASSHRIETQLTMGADKLLLVGNSTIAAGGTAHGIKAVRVNGPTPEVLPGRTGDQYAEYIESMTAELYRVARIPDIDEDKNVNSDPNQQIYSALRKKKRFAQYVEKFTEFQAARCELALRLMKEYAPDEVILEDIGRNEWANLAEFRNTQDLRYQIRLEEVDDDIDTVFGKQVALNSIVQYVGPTLEKGDLGKVIRSMPFLAQEELLSDLTADYDNATNDILALDRGEWAEPNIDDNHQYMIKRLTQRMKQPDFKYLPPNIQAAYAQKREMHQQLEVDQMKKIKAAQSELIPTGGFMVACDFYVPTGDDPSKTKRVRLPSESINWLVQQLERQGSALSQLEAQEQGPVAAMSEQFVNEVGGTPEPSTQSTFQDAGVNPLVLEAAEALA